MEHRYHIKHVVSWQDIDCNGHFSLHAFANLMQEAAWEHAEKLGFGFDYMAQHQAVWVLMETRLQFFGQPQWRDEIDLTTWHKGSKGIISFRDYLLTDKGGEPLMKASTDWVLINHETRRLVRPDILSPFQDTVVMEDALPDFHIEENASTHENETVYKVCFSDLDFNGHVNNGRYYEWIANLFEPHNTAGKAVEKMQIKYQSECFLNDELLLRYKFLDNTFQVQGLQKESGKKVFFAMMELH